MHNMDNCIEIHGRIVRDFDVQTSAAGTVYVKFSVAVGRNGKNDADKTDYFDCVDYGKSAEALAKCFYKGKPIRIRGRMECDPYPAKDGSKRYPWTVKVDSWAFDLNDPKSAPRQVDNAQSGDVQTYDSWEQFEADLPFDV